MRVTGCWVFVLSAITVVSLVGAVRADDEEVLRQFSGVIAKEPGITDSRRALLVSAARDTLSQFGDLGPDKQRYAAADLKAYLDNVLPGTQAYSDAQFRVVVQSFRWSLGNYARLDPVSDQDRAAAHDRVAAIGQAMREFVDKSYTDTPSDIRQEIAEQVAKSLEAIEARAGNYFYPPYLYPSGNRVDSAGIVKSLSEQPLASTYSTRFARVASILADKALPDESKRVQREMFVSMETSSMTGAAMALMPTMCDLSTAIKKGQYLMPPKDLVDAEAALVEELAAAGRRAVEENNEKSRQEYLQSIVTQGKAGVKGVAVELAKGARETKQAASQGKQAARAQVSAARPTAPADSQAGTRWLYILVGMAALAGVALIAVPLAKRRKATKGQR